MFIGSTVEVTSNPFVTVATHDLGDEYLIDAVQADGIGFGRADLFTSLNDITYSSLLPDLHPTGSDLWLFPATEARFVMLRLTECIESPCSIGEIAFRLYEPSSAVPETGTLLLLLVGLLILTWSSLRK